MLVPLRGGDRLSPTHPGLVPARPADWGELLARADVTEHLRLGTRVGVLAFHGGLEEGTLQIASGVAAATGASLYTVTQPPDLRWHVPSHRVDPAGSPLLAALLDHIEVALTVHGYGGRGRPFDVLLGGRARELAPHLAAGLAHVDTRLRGVTDLDRIPADLRGLHAANPVNRPPRTGVQVELPVRARYGPVTAEVISALAAGVRRWPGHPGAS